MNSNNWQRRLRFATALLMVALSPLTLKADDPNEAVACAAIGSGTTCCYFEDVYCLGSGSGWLFDYRPCQGDCGGCDG